MLAVTRHSACERAACVVHTCSQNHISLNTSDKNLRLLEADMDTYAAHARTALHVCDAMSSRRIAIAAACMQHGDWTRDSLLQHHHFCALCSHLSGSGEPANPRSNDDSIVFKVCWGFVAGMHRCWVYWKCLFYCSSLGMGNCLKDCASGPSGAMQQVAL